MRTFTLQLAYLACAQEHLGPEAFAQRDDPSDESLSLLQTRAERHPDRKIDLLGTSRSAMNHTLASTTYIPGRSSRHQILESIKDEAEFPADDDETPARFQQHYARRRETTIPGDWTLGTILYNNLGGVGPDSGTEGIRYGSITTVNGRSVDLIVNALGPYQKYDKAVNGLNGLLGKINLYHDRNVDLKFSFVDSETSAPVTMGALKFSVFDLDEGPDGTAKETFTMGGFTADYLMDFTSIKTTDLPDGRRQYTSSQHGRGGNNPDDPFSLSEVQAAHSVTFELPEGQDSFTVNYAVTTANHRPRAPGEGFNGRNFLFGGASSLYYCQAEPIEIHYDLAQVMYSNLGGGGPDFGQPEGIHYHNIATVQGRTIDLHVNAVGEYEPFKATRNGMKGHYGILNMHKNYQATFDFKFVDAATQRPETLNSVYFSVFDMDEGKWGKLRESVIMQTPYSAAFLTEDTDVNRVVQADGSVRFDSMVPGTGKDNPRDPMTLTELQKNRAVTFLFDTQSEWRVSLLVGNGPPSGRNYMFAGKSNVVFC